MHNKKLYMALAVVLLIAVSASYMYINAGQGLHTKKGVYIVVTFSSLYPDIREVVCKTDEVAYIAPPGVDPHEYLLSSQNVRSLKLADIIVSTAHAPFEVQIRKMKENGELKAELIEIINIPGIRLRNNPVLGTPNYHMPIYDPENYLIYMRYVVKILSEKNPACSKTYLDNYEKIAAEINQTTKSFRKLDIVAAAISPVAQYAVEWTGIRIKYLFQKEHDLPATPEDIASIEKAAARGELGAIITLQVSKKTPLMVKAEEIAEKYRIPLIRIPSPTEQKPMYVKIKEVVEQLKILQKS